MTKTRSLKKVNSTSSALFMVILLLAFVIVFGINSKPVDAESTYTVSGQYVTEDLQTWTPGISEVPNKVKTTFSLYKVGHYENINGKSVIDQSKCKQCGMCMKVSKTGWPLHRQ